MFSMATLKWAVSGRFLARRGYWQTFTKHCEAERAELAKEWVLSEIGGCHHVPRQKIRIEKVEEVAG